MRVAALPLAAQRREPLARECVEHSTQLHQQQRKHLVAVERPAAGALQVRHFLVDAAAHRVRQTHVDADADHGQAGPQRIALRLDQDAGELLPPPQHIVGPLEARIGDAEFLNGARERHAHGQAQTRQSARALGKPPQQRKRERPADAGVPGASLPAAST